MKKTRSAKGSLLAGILALILLFAAAAAACVLCTRDKTSSFPVSYPKIEGETQKNYLVYVTFETEFSEDLLYDSAWVKFKSFGKGTDKVNVHVAASNYDTSTPTTGYLGNFGYNTARNDGTEIGRSYEATKDNLNKWINVSTIQPGTSSSGGNATTAQYRYYIVAIQGECEIEELVVLCHEKESEEYKLATLKVHDAGVIKVSDVSTTKLDAGTWLTKEDYKSAAARLLDGQKKFDITKVSYGEREGNTSEAKNNRRYAVYAN